MSDPDSNGTNVFRRTLTTLTQRNPPPREQHMGVNRVLKSYHIFMITLSITIGMGIFEDTGEILRLAGPGGAICTILLVGIGVICVMECIAEMIGHWPIPNAMVEFVKAFLDEDLAIFIGVAYWYAYALNFATLLVVAVGLAGYWNGADNHHLILVVFIFVVVGALFVLNNQGVWWYGAIELVAGSLKTFLVVFAFISACVLAGLRDQTNTDDLDAGFQSDDEVATNWGVAALASAPIVAFAFVGVEIVAVIAVEAKDSRTSLKYPSILIAPFMVSLYFISAIAYYASVAWNDSELPSLPGVNSKTASSNSNSKGESESIVVIAAIREGKDKLADVLNVFLILAVLSTANTALYVASRILFGLTKEIDPNGPPPLRWLSRLAETTKTKKIPLAALWVSTLAFWWVPWLTWNQHIISGVKIQEIMSSIATVAVVLVWASQCLVFLRYRAWLNICHKQISTIDDFKQFDYHDKSNNRHPYKTLLHKFQPWVAIFGLFFCFVMVFVLPTASWWIEEGTPSAVDVCEAFIAPGTVFVFWGLMKLYRYLKNRSGFTLIVPLDADFDNGLRDKLMSLNDGIQGIADQSSEIYSEEGQELEERPAKKTVSTNQTERQM